MRLIHLTDPHLTSLDDVPLGRLRGKQWLGYQSWWRRRRHIHLRSRLDTLLEHVRLAKPDAILLTGDLVHIAATEELEAAADWLADLTTLCQIIFTPGNHDLYHPAAQEQIARLWARWLPVHDYPTEHRFAEGQLQVIALNSSVHMPWYSAGGQISAQALHRLSEMNAQNRSAVRILALHHPPVAQIVSRRKALRNTTALAPLLGTFDVVVHGHGHRSLDYNVGNTRIFSTSSASAPDGSFRIFDVADNAIRMQHVNADGTLLTEDTWRSAHAGNEQHGE